MFSFLSPSPFILPFFLPQKLYLEMFLLILASPRGRKALVPDQELNPRPLQWKRDSLTTGLPEKSWFSQFSFFFKIFFFFKWNVFKSLLNLLQYSVSCFPFFGHEACGIFIALPGMELALSTLEGKVLTSGLPGKPWFSHYFKFLGCTWVFIMVYCKYFLGKVEAPVLNSSDTREAKVRLFCLVTCTDV